MRVLVYVDSPAMVPSAVAVGKALRSELAADILVLTVNSARHRDEFPPEFEIRDLGDLAGEQAQGGRRRRPGIRDVLRFGVFALFSPFVLYSLAKGHGPSKGVDDARAIMARLASPFKKFLLRFALLRDMHAILSTQSYRRGLRSFLGFSKPAAIVVFEDNIETLTRILVAVGDRMGVPSIVVPYTIPNPLEPATPLLASPPHSVGDWGERILTSFKSDWIYRLQGRRISRLPLLRAIGIELMGLSVPRPWILNSGSAAAIALDSEAARRTYLNLGFPSTQLAVVGEPVGERLHEGLLDRSALRRRLSASNGLESSERPFVVCAFPPDQYRGTDTRAYEASTFEELVDAWMEVLLEISQYANVLIRPHPRLAIEPLKRYETSQLRVTSEATAELVPAADLYIASISATIRWAIACGIPVINYDCYRYRYDDYGRAGGVVTVDSRDEFRAASKRFFSEPSFGQELRERQRLVMGDWGLVDSGFAGRFASLLTRVTQEPG